MIIVCGEALFDMMGTRTEAGQAFLPVVGGSPLNVAMGARRLGREVEFLSKLSTDWFGSRLDGFMEREAIGRRFLVRAPGMQTTLAFVALGEDGQPEYSFYGTGAADRSMTPDDLPAALPDDLAAVHFGSISLAQEPTATTLLGFMERVAPTRVVTLDPNIRPSIIPDRALYLERFARMLGLADIVKASAEDLEWMLGGKPDLEAVARAWSLAGPALAFVTDGGRGAVVAAKGQARFVPAERVAVADTIGAGDTFQAAVLAFLDERGLLDKAALRGLDTQTIQDLTLFAVSAAAITCTRQGADLPTRAEAVAAYERRKAAGAASA
ncbi:carbohydrate kinase family protein [Prosthecomicrobium sp. N25]|uniref:carbohydrate kinase family protein n=1 Tax=Prosthecomicrobium sp. N25 TaxID=3129254 RepID=UPI003078579C